MKKITKSILLLAMVALWSYNKKPVPEIVYFTGWKFKTGDSLSWAKPDYNDAAWDTRGTTVIVAIMGRMSAYTGKEVSFEEVMNSDMKLGPDTIQIGTVNYKTVIHLTGTGV